MLLIIKALANLFSALNSEESPRQVAAGFAYGVMLGLLPLGLLATILGLFAFLININLAMMAVAALIFKIVAYLVDPIANQLGFLFLTKIPSLVPFWTKLYNLPVIPYTKFNNTIVLGSLVIGVSLFIPMYLLAMKAVFAYRTHLRDKVDQWKIVKVVKASTFYKYYLSYKGMTGE